MLISRVINPDFGNIEGHLDMSFGYVIWICHLDNMSFGYAIWIWENDSSIERLVWGLNKSDHQIYGLPVYLVL